MFRFLDLVERISCPKRQKSFAKAKDRAQQSPLTHWQGFDRTMRLFAIWCRHQPCAGHCRWLPSVKRWHPAACRHAQLPHRKSISLRHLFDSGLGGRRRLPSYANTQSAGRPPLECRRPLAHPRQGIRTCVEALWKKQAQAGNVTSASTGSEEGVGTP